MQATQERIKPASMGELQRLLAEYDIDTRGWGTGTIHSLDRLLQTLKHNDVFFAQPHQTNGARPPLDLHVNCVVVNVWYMSTPMRNLYEKRQTFPNGDRFERHATFDGLGETLNNNEDRLAGAHRLLREELGESQPLFKDPTQYTLFEEMLVTVGPTTHDKWPLRNTYFHRAKYICEIGHDSPLYLPDGYVEHEPPEEGGRTIEFAWKDIDSN